VADQWSGQCRTGGEDSEFSEGPVVVDGGGPMARGGSPALTGGSGG
jgi:hypothetical protein